MHIVHSVIHFLRRVSFTNESISSPAANRIFFLNVYWFMQFKVFAAGAIVLVYKVLEKDVMMAQAGKCSLNTISRYPTSESFENICANI